MKGGNEKEKQGEKEGELLRLNEFLFSLNIDNLNLFKVLRFVQEKDLIKKVSEITFTHSIAWHWIFAEVFYSR